MPRNAHRWCARAAWPAGEAMLHVVLYEPEIPPNTGNVIRLCANSGARLHLIRPLGFDLDHAKLRRAGLDYHEFAQVVVHENLAAFVAATHPTRLFALSTRGRTLYSSVQFHNDDALLFGPETRGLPQSVLDALPPAQCLHLPMRPGNRSLNLSNAVAVVVYEAWRQMAFGGAANPSQ
jgi:tRNA (cytidine/uridine-2'-O-)-methyltransferase